MASYHMDCCTENFDRFPWQSLVTQNVQAQTGTEYIQIHYDHLIFFKAEK
jgi:hypothetical protein